MTIEVPGWLCVPGWFFFVSILSLDLGVTCAFFDTNGLVMIQCVFGYFSFGDLFFLLAILKVFFINT